MEERRESLCKLWDRPVCAAVAVCFDALCQNARVDWAAMCSWQEVSPLFTCSPIMQRSRGKPRVICR